MKKSFFKGSIQSTSVFRCW